MNTTRYYFPNLIEDENLSILAVQAKETLQRNADVARIFELNNEYLCGDSPRQLLFLMNQNNKSIFSPSPIPNNEGQPSNAESNQGLSTPVTRNPDNLNIRRRHLPFDDAETRENYSLELGPSSFCKRQTVTVSPKIKAVLNPTTAETPSHNQRLSSPIGSTSSHEADNQESPRSAEIAKMTSNLTIAEKELETPGKVADIIRTSRQESPIIHETGNQESPRSTEIAKMTANLTMAEKKLETPGKGAGIIHASRQKSPRNHEAGTQESPRSAEIAKMTENLTMAEKELGNPAKIVDSIYEESTLASEIKKLASNFTKDDKDSRSLIQDDKVAGSFSKKMDSLTPKENAGKTDYSDPANKDSIGHAEGKLPTSKPTIFKIETPSPAKKPKICSISNLDTQDFVCSSEKVSIPESSVEDSEAIASPIQGDKINISPNVASKEITKSTLKRKSASPRKSKPTLFRSIPRVVQSSEEEIDIEVICDFEDDSRPSTSRSCSVDYRSDSTKFSIKTPVMGESKSKTSPSILERLLQSSETSFPHSSSRNVSETSSTDSDDDIKSSDGKVFAGKYSSNISSIVTTETRDGSCKSESSATYNDASDFLKHVILKFNVLHSFRDQVLQKSFISLLSFKSYIEFIMNYVLNLENILLKIGISDKGYSTKELRDIADEAGEIAKKIKKRLNSWQKDVESDIDTWQKCFEQIHQLKSQNEPLLTNNGETAVSSEVLQVYEYQMKSIWKIMDDMIMVGDSRRSLFTQIFHEIEKLMKIFIKCLIDAGLLIPR